MKLLRDHPVSEEFALLSGKLIQNFGVVELLSHRWIEVLSRSAIAMEIAMELPLAKRIDIIIRLLARSHNDMSAEQVTEANTCWSQLRDKGCELRNSVAHGTIGLRFHEDDTMSTPEVAGILKLRKWSATDQLLGLDELKGAVNVTHNIVEKLSKML
jgi:hypothetical protein